MILNCHGWSDFNLYTRRRGNLGYLESVCFQSWLPGSKYAHAIVATISRRWRPSGRRPARWRRRWRLFAWRARGRQARGSWLSLLLIELLIHGIVGLVSTISRIRILTPVILRILSAIVYWASGARRTWSSGYTWGGLNSRDGLWDRLLTPVTTEIAAWRTVTLTIAWLIRGRRIAPGLWGRILFEALILLFDVGE